MLVKKSFLSRCRRAKYTFWNYAKLSATLMQIKPKKQKPPRQIYLISQLNKKMLWILQRTQINIKSNRINSFWSIEPSQQYMPCVSGISMNQTCELFATFRTLCRCSSSTEHLSVYQRETTGDNDDKWSLLTLSQGCVHHDAKWYLWLHWFTTSVEYIICKIIWITKQTLF